MINSLSSLIKNQKDIEINLAEEFDVFSQSSLADLYQEKKTLGLRFYVAFVQDESEFPFITQASEIAKWNLNLNQKILPTNRREIKELAIYCYDQSSEKFKYFCDRIDLATKPYFACLIAINDENLCKREQSEAYKILANCCHFGQGGATQDLDQAVIFANHHCFLENEIAKESNSAAN